MKASTSSTDNPQNKQQSRISSISHISQATLPLQVRSASCVLNILSNETKHRLTNFNSLKHESLIRTKLKHSIALESTIA